MRNENVLRSPKLMVDLNCVPSLNALHSMINSANKTFSRIIFFTLYVYDIVAMARAMKLSATGLFRRWTD